MHVADFVTFPDSGTPLALKAVDTPAGVLPTMTTAATNPTAFASDEHAALPLRGDTFLGICEAIGQDFGFNPNFLRVPLATLILWDPKIVIGAYLALGVVVAISRFFYPAAHRPAAAAPAEGERRDAQTVLAMDAESEELLAA
jgi:phage shock protein PspC (stress-responsive transcriptional regulator)